MAVDDDRLPEVARADSGLPPAGQEGPAVSPDEAGGGDTGAMVAPPRPEVQEERLDMGLPDSMGGPVLPLADEDEPDAGGQLSGRGVTTPGGKGGSPEAEGEVKLDPNTPGDMGAQYWGQAS